MGINMSIPSNKCCPQHLINYRCVCMKNSSKSHVAFSIAKFFHLTRYSTIAQFFSSGKPQGIKPCKTFSVQNLTKYSVKEQFLLFHNIHSFSLSLAQCLSVNQRKFQLKMGLLTFIQIPCHHVLANEMDLNLKYHIGLKHFFNINLGIGIKKNYFFCLYF